MKIESSNFLDARGKLEDYVLYTWRGQKCLRARRRSSGNGALPRGMVAQQERYAAIAVFYREMKLAGLYVYWQRAAQGMVRHGYNLFLQANLRAFLGNGSIGDFTKLQLTPGLMPYPNGLSLTSGEDGMWELTWDTSVELPGTAGDDRLLLFAMKDRETFTLAPVEVGEVCRANGVARWRMDEKLSEFGHLFVIFCSRTMEKCTSSRYYILNPTIYGKV